MISEATARAIGEADVDDDGRPREPLTQLGVATLLAAELQDYILWRDDIKRWYSLDSGSGIWRPAPTETAVQEEVDEILLRLARRRHQTDAFSAAVTRALSRRLARPGGDFDGDPWLLGAQNGVIELQTSYLRPASPDKYITRQCPVSYDDEAPCPLWESHLYRLFEEDEERVGWFQQAVGCSLVGRADLKDQIFVYLIGPGGNGKGTTMRTLISVFGQDQYAANINPNDLSRDRHLAWMHRLKGTRLAVVEEVRNSRLDVSKLKSLTGADTIVANRMRQEDETWAPTHTLFMTANHAPILDDTSGMERRYRPIQTGPSIEASEIDPRYEAAIRSELPGILAWAVRGCLLWQRNGCQLAQLDVSRFLAQEHLQDNDPFLEWGEECVSAEEDGWVTRQQVIANYNWWAASRSLPNLSATGQRQLYEWLRLFGAQDVRRASGRGFTGLALTGGTC